MGLCGGSLVPIVERSDAREMPTLMANGDSDQVVNVRLGRQGC